MEKEIDKFSRFLGSLTGQTAISCRGIVAKEIIKYEEKLWPILSFMASSSICH